MNKSSKTILSVLIFWSIFWLLLIALQAFPQLGGHDWAVLIAGCLLVGLSLLLVFLFLKHEHRTAGGLGLTWSFKSLWEFALGTIIGIVVVGVMLLILITLTPVSVQRVASPDFWNATAYAALVLFVLALMEEIVFRSYPLFRLKESVGIRTSIYVTSLFFALYHGLDPMNLLGPGVWGLFFGLAAFWTKAIALPLGLHFGLNWLQSLFGMKLQYASSIWMIVPGDKDTAFTSEVVGMFMQIILLIIGLSLIELFIRKKGGMTKH